MVFLSGGDPAYLASVLDGTACWTAIVKGVRSGLAYGGCSAGVAALGERAIRPKDAANPAPGLRLFDGTNFGPHWDTMDRYLPGRRRALVEGLGGDARLVGIDERTAMVGDGRAWSAVGRGRVHVLDNGTWSEYPAGTTFALDLIP